MRTERCAFCFSLYTHTWLTFGIARCSQATVVDEPKIDAEPAAVDGDGDASQAVQAAKGDLAPNGHAPHHVSPLAYPRRVAHVIDS